MDKIDLSQLSVELDYQWKVQSITKGSNIAICVAYIDARDAMDLLDRVCGQENWTREYKEINHSLYCGVSIKINSEWITKWDLGTESKEEKEKGEASDAFKRACVSWGIARGCYRKEEIRLKTVTSKYTGKLVPIDHKGNVLYNSKSLTKYIRSMDEKIPDPEYRQSSVKAKKEDQLPEDFIKATEDTWRDVIVHFGKHKGVKFGDLPYNTRFGFTENWKPPAKETPQDANFEIMLAHARTEQPLREELKKLANNRFFDKKDAVIEWLKSYPNATALQEAVNRAKATIKHNEKLTSIEEEDLDSLFADQRDQDTKKEGSLKVSSLALSFSFGSFLFLSPFLLCATSNCSCSASSV